MAKRIYTAKIQTPENIRSAASADVYNARKFLANAESTIEFLERHPAVRGDLQDELAEAHRALPIAQADLANCLRAFAAVS